MLERLAAAAASFTPEQYLWWTRLQCLGWTAADVVIVVALIRFSNAARRLHGRGAHMVPWLVLAATLPFIPMVVVAPTGRLIFALELCITLPHFLLILYLLGVNHRVFRALVEQLHQQAREDASSLSGGRG
jgi:hypothetical protein